VCVCFLGQETHTASIHPAVNCGEVNVGLSIPIHTYPYITVNELLLCLSHPVYRQPLLFCPVSVLFNSLFLWDVFIVATNVLNIDKFHISSELALLINVYFFFTR